MKITWNADVNAPGCPGEIVAEDGRTVLIQTDWDYPGTAQTFGWTLEAVQRCPQCKELAKTRVSDGDLLSSHCDGCGQLEGHCDHDATDGTVDCPECGVTAGEFITAAYDWLRDNDGATADDPGYFSEGGGKWHL